MRTVTTINGRLVPRKDAKVSVFDNSLLYAEGLFETFLAIDDHAIFEKEHLERLYKGARTIGLDIPVEPDKMARWMTKTLRAHPARIKKLRLTMTAGESARWTGRKGKPQVLLSASPHAMPTDPFRLLVSDYKVDGKSIFRRIKTLSYIIHAAALSQAHEKGWDDALLINQRGHVAEVTSANIFWVRSGRIYTPPLSSGCLEGVTRKVTLREAGALGLKIAERNCSLERMLDADEIFISSSLKLVVPVAQIRVGRRTHEFPIGTVGLRFAKRFREMVGVR